MGLFLGRLSVQTLSIPGSVQKLLAAGSKRVILPLLEAVPFPEELLPSRKQDPAYRLLFLCFVQGSECFLLSEYHLIPDCPSIA